MPRLGLSAAARTATPYKIGKSPLPPKRRASPIVLQLLAQDIPARTSARRYLITQETARELPVRVRLHNLSSARSSDSGACLPGGSPEPKEPVAVPAMGFVDVAWKPDATHALDLAQTRFITVTAKSSGDVQPTPLAIPLTMEGTLEQHLATHKSQVLYLSPTLQNGSRTRRAKSNFSVTSEGPGGWMPRCPCANGNFHPGDAEGFTTNVVSSGPLLATISGHQRAEFHHLPGLSQLREGDGQPGGEPLSFPLRRHARRHVQRQ